MKPFDIEQVKKGEKVITRCGLKAEFVHDSYDNRYSSDDQFIFTIYDSYNNPIFNGSYLKTGREAYSNGSFDYDLFMAEDSDFLTKKDEKPIYYRGNPERGDEIIADLTKRGGKNNNNYYTADDDRGAYYINQFGFIDCISYELAKKSLDRCTELQLPPKKVKKEGWINLVDYGLSRRSCIIPSGNIYDSESEAKEAVKRFDSSLKDFKTIKIDWEEIIK